MEISSTDHVNTQANKILVDSRKKKEAADQEYVESIDSRQDKKELIQAERETAKYHARNALADFLETSLNTPEGGARTKDSILASIKSQHLAI